MMVFRIHETLAFTSKYHKMYYFHYIFTLTFEFQLQ